MDEGKIRSVIDALWAPNEKGETPEEVFAILDGARDKRIYPMLHKGDVEHSCLYTGVKVYELARAAPYLVPVTKNSKILHEILRIGWGESFGCFVINYKARTLEKVRRNCRRIAKAEGPNGKPMVFRYYDPRVMRLIMPTFDAEDYALIYKDVDAFACENSQFDGLNFYKIDRLDTSLDITNHTIFS